MPTATQAINAYGYPVPPAPLEQIRAGATISGSTMLHEASDSFLWGRSLPASQPGRFVIYEGSVVFEGSGFVYDGGLLPSSGTITSMSVCQGGSVSANEISSYRPQVTLSDLSIDLSEMRDELLQALSGNTGPLNDYFLTLQWTYQGSSGDDHFEGGNLDDVITGNGGRDWLYGLGGNDKIYGGESSDDRLFGGDGTDTLYGYGWDDYLNGGAGADVLNGGWGSDWADYSGASKGVTASLANPSMNTGDAAGDTYISIENLYGSDFGDVLIGDNAANRFFGGKGNDVFVGGGGADEFYGGGFAFKDSTDGIDTVDYSTSTLGIVVSIANPWHNTGDAKGDTYRSIENLIGSNFNDKLYGTNSANVIDGLDGHNIIKGYGGNDTLRGGTGSDTLHGGTGADKLIGGDGRDTASYSGATTGVTVSLANPGINTGEAAGDTFVSIENLTGSDFDDVIYGDGGANTLNGRAGNDKISGGAGADRLTGGLGADWFVFSSVADSSPSSAGRDTILDFARTHGDKIDLQAIDANTGEGGDQAFTFIGTAAYSNTAGELRYRINGSETIISGDVNGDGVADFRIALDRGLAMLGTDFWL